MSLGTRECIYESMTSEELDQEILRAMDRLKYEPNPLIAKLFPAPKQAVENVAPPAELETERPRRKILH